MIVSPATNSCCLQVCYNSDRVLVTHIIGYVDPTTWRVRLPVANPTFNSQDAQKAFMKQQQQLLTSHQQQLQQAHSLLKPATLQHQTLLQRITRPGNSPSLEATPSATPPPATRGRLQSATTSDRYPNFTEEEIDATLSDEELELDDDRPLDPVEDYMRRHAQRLEPLLRRNRLPDDGSPQSKRAATTDVVPST